jgi:hypothetical protein
MTDYHRRIRSPNPFAMDQGMVARADAEWESIMVQITLAFVIILGYLISKGMTDTAVQRRINARLESRNAALESLVADFGSSELGQERSQRIQLQWDLQLERLLASWERACGERTFHRLLEQFHDAEMVSLSDDLASLPTESSFQELNTEVDRIFLSGTEKVSAEEITRLLHTVVAAAGYDPEAVIDQDTWERLSPEERALYDDPKKLLPDNLRKLTLQITAALDQERRRLVDIQYALVGKIAAARLEKLAALPLNTETGIDVNTPDLGRFMLERILQDLRRGIRLLPETAERLRGVDESTQSGEQPRGR